MLSLSFVNFVGWIKRKARIHRLNGGYGTMCLYPPYDFPSVHYFVRKSE